MVAIANLSLGSTWIDLSPLMCLGKPNPRRECEAERTFCRDLGEGGEGGKEERGCMVREGEGWWYRGKVVHGEGRKMVL